MKFLVSGSTGFVGTKVVAFLKSQGHEVVGVSGYKPSQKRLTIPMVGRGAELQPAALDFGPDVIVHAATYFVGQHQSSDIARLVDANIACGMELLEIAQATDAKFLTLSSSWQHFDGATYSPVNLYAATKQGFDDIVTFYEDSGVHVDRLTLFDTFGPGDRRGKIVSLLLQAAKSGEALAVGAKTNLIDLTYVDDVARAICAVAADDSNRGPIDAVIRSGPVPLVELVETIIRAIECPVPVVWEAREARPREMQTDWIFGQPLDGWHPEISLSEGIKRTWADSWNAKRE